jgi:outer membrane protein assembly factor BamB
VDDLDGDGRPEIVAGCTNSQISAFDTNLERLWNRDGIYHGVRKVLASDLDGDGKKEVLAADHYGSVAIIAADGRSCGGAYSELGDVCFDVGDINGDGRPELVNGSSTGVLSAFSYPVTPLFQFSNYGYAVREVKVLDLEGDGRAAVLVASDTGYLYALDGGGKVRWQRDLGAALLAMAIGQTGRPGVGGRYLAVGQRDGTVRALDLAGAPLAEFAVGRSVKFLKCFDLNGDGADEIVVVDTGNRCFVLGLSL